MHGYGTEESACMDMRQRSLHEWVWDRGVCMNGYGTEESA